MLQNLHALSQGLDTKLAITDFEARIDELLISQGEKIH
jgi:hypothetical protein